MDNNFVYCFLFFLKENVWQSFPIHTYLPGEKSRKFAVSGCSPATLHQIKSDTDLQLNFVRDDGNLEVSWPVLAWMKKTLYWNEILLLELQIPVRPLETIAAFPLPQYYFHLSILQSIELVW